MKTDSNNAVLVCWPATVVGKDEIENFEAFMKSTFNSEIKYAEEFLTLPDMKNGEPVPETGGRNDVLFFVANDDIPKFAIARLSFGMRWWEDVVAPINGGGAIIPPEILNKYSEYA